MLLTLNENSFTGFDGKIDFRSFDDLMINTPKSIVLTIEFTDYFNPVEVSCKCDIRGLYVISEDLFYLHRSVNEFEYYVLRKYESYNKYIFTKSKVVIMTNDTFDSIEGYINQPNYYKLINYNFVNKNEALTLFNLRDQNQLRKLTINFKCFKLLNLYVTIITLFGKRWLIPVMRRLTTRQKDIYLI